MRRVGDRDVHPVRSWSRAVAEHRGHARRDRVEFLYDTIWSSVLPVEMTFSPDPTEIDVRFRVGQAGRVNFSSARSSANALHRTSGARAPRPRAAGLPRPPGRRHDVRRAGREPGRAAARRHDGLRQHPPVHRREPRADRAALLPHPREALAPAAAPARPPAGGTDRAPTPTRWRPPSARSSRRWPTRRRSTIPRPRRRSPSRASSWSGPCSRSTAAPTTRPGSRSTAPSSCGSSSTCATTSTSATSPRNDRRRAPRLRAAPLRRPGRRRHQPARRRSRSNGSRQCRQELRDPRHAHQAIATIGRRWGFVDPSHFGRAFRRDLRGHTVRVASLGRHRRR